VFAAQKVPARSGDPLGRLGPGHDRDSPTWSPTSAAWSWFERGTAPA
jgi:hypothetical protein